MAEYAARLTAIACALGSGVHASVRPWLRVIDAGAGVSGMETSCAWAVKLPSTPPDTLTVSRSPALQALGPRSSSA